MFQQEDQGTFFVTWESIADARGGGLGLEAFVSKGVSEDLTGFVTFSQSEVTF